MDDKVAEALLALREQTRKTGILYPEQEQQLKYWPMIIDPAIVGCETRFSYEKSEVEYAMKAKGKLGANVKEKWPQLDEWTKFLFGNEYSVKIKVNDKTEFRGKRLEDPPNKSIREDEEYLNDIDSDFQKDKYKMGRYKVK